LKKESKLLVFSEPVTYIYIMDYSTTRDLTLSIETLE